MALFGGTVPLVEIYVVVISREVPKHSTDDNKSGSQLLRPSGQYPKARPRLISKKIYKILHMYLNTFHRPERHKDATPCSSVIFFTSTI